MACGLHIVLSNKRKKKETNNIACGLHAVSSHKGGKKGELDEAACGFYAALLSSPP